LSKEHADALDPGLGVAQQLDQLAPDSEAGVDGNTGDVPARVRR
jgi:hypothetical protein